MRGKKRPLDERAHAVGIAVVAGGAEASRQTGIPEQTINQWMHTPEFGELRERTKEAVAAEWYGGVQLAFRRAIALLDTTDDAVKAATAGAIMFDKLALTRGEATSRSESRDLTKVSDDHELTTLRDFIDRLDGPAGTAGDTGEAAGTEAADRSEVRQPSAESLL
jgi:hypothetical protein